MFTIEHDFDASVVTLVDEGKMPLVEDVIIQIFDEGITIEQYDQRTDAMAKVVLSHAQVRDLEAALDLPEGSYRLKKMDDKP
ncbi:MAG: hypothetical protein AAF198_01690 [Pseudomonadota bacterium]